MSDEERLQEQMAYYRARAGEYDQWFLRQGRFDHGAEQNRQWFAEVEQAARALADFESTGRVLELAAGTGWWTEHLIRYADSVTAVDASAETLTLNRARNGESSVRYVQTDIFTWKPDAHYDVVFFSFWLSHVPPERFAAFWNLVRACLAPKGRVFFIDSQYNPLSTASDHRLEGEKATTMTRRLNDGREFRIVKVFYRPEELTARLAALGWRVTVSTTESHFLYGSGTRKKNKKVVRSLLG